MLFHSELWIWNGKRLFFQEDFTRGGDQEGLSRALSNVLDQEVLLTAVIDQALASKS
jgi:hypothetical protein